MVNRLHATGFIKSEIVCPQNKFGLLDGIVQKCVYSPKFEQNKNIIILY